MSRFEVRKWSNTNVRPFDVVYITDDGKSHYQPGACFSTEDQAMKHKSSLEQSAETSGVKFILDNWPID